MTIKCEIGMRCSDCSEEPYSCANSVFTVELERHVGHYFERIKSASVACQDMKMTEIISVALCIAADHYEELKEEGS
jgi:hypothetical protein